MNIFLEALTKEIPDNIILFLCCDEAACHKAGSLHVQENVHLFFIPPNTPKMNPIEQIWKEVHKLGFRNEIFATLEKVAEPLCDMISSLTATSIHSITAQP